MVQLEICDSFHIYDQHFSPSFHWDCFIFWDFFIYSCIFVIQMTKNILIVQGEPMPNRKNTNYYKRDDFFWFHFLERCKTEVKVCSHLAALVCNWIYMDALLTMSYGKKIVLLRLIILGVLFYLCVIGYVQFIVFCEFN